MNYHVMWMGADPGRAIVECMVSLVEHHPQERVLIWLDLGGGNPALAASGILNRPNVMVKHLGELEPDARRSFPVIWQALDAGRKFQSPYSLLADMYRLVAVRKFGGAYVDSDMMIFRNMNGLFEGGKLVMFEEGDRWAGSAIFGCTGEHEKLVGELIGMGARKRNFDHWGFIGPQLFNEYLHSHRQSVSLHGKNIFFSVHHTEMNRLIGAAKEEVLAEVSHPEAYGLHLSHEYMRRHRKESVPVVVKQVTRPPSPVLVPWTAGDIAVVFSTVARTPDYLPETLKSFEAADERVSAFSEISLVVGSPSEKHIDEQTREGRFKVCGMSAPEWDRIKDQIVHQRALVNYYRCLTLVGQNARGLLVFEDDVKFRPGFVGMVLQALNEMQERGLRDFMLALYAAYDFEADRSLRRGTFYSSYPAHWFYGTQAMFFTRKTADEAAHILHDRGVVKYDQPYDMVLKDYAKERQNLYATRKSLVQHVGRASTGIGHHHTTPTFEHAWPD